MVKIKNRSRFTPDKVTKINSFELEISIEKKDYKKTGRVTKYNLSFLFWIDSVKSYISLTNESKLLYQYLMLTQLDDTSLPPWTEVKLEVKVFLCIS